MKKDNMWHILWIVGIFAILVLILYLVVQYKVKWQGRDLNDYVYFYNCSNNLCTTTENVDDYYSSIRCSDNSCPYITEKKNNYVIVNNNGVEYVFDYFHGKVINDIYRSYKFADDNYIVGDTNGKYGVIDGAGEIVEEIKYGEIYGYRDGFITFIENGKMGIVNPSKQIDIKPIYDEVNLINGSIYAYLEDNKYYIAQYNTELPINNTNYNYLYVIDSNTILLANDQKIDIVDSNLKSTLILKIDTSYRYETEKERKTLNIIKEGNFVKFGVVGSDNTIVNYIYDIKNRKMYN